MSALPPKADIDAADALSDFAVLVVKQVDRGLSRYRVGQKLEGGSRKGMHIVEPLGAAGLKRNSPLDAAGDRKTRVAGRVT
jgi:hypothetical protein